MPDLTFRIEGATPQPATAQLLLRLRIEDAKAEPIHSILLRCQIRIEPARRRYSPGEEARLIDLFGTPDRWGQTVRPLSWAAATLTVPAFTGTTTVGLPVPCDRDPTQGAVRFLDALEDGEAPVFVLFSGSVFYEAAGVGRQVAPIPWDREARYRLPVADWHQLFADAVTP